MLALPVCEFSACKQYRYTLWRRWKIDSDLFEAGGREDSFLQVIGLNPSTADERQDDPTIRRCIGYAKAWGYGALCMTNLFAWRDTDPQKMKAQPDPVGAENDRWLIEIAKHAGMILAAWGKHGAHMNRAAHVVKMLPAIHALWVNADGTPKHPLYCRADLIPFPYIPGKIYP